MEGKMCNGGYQQEKLSKITKCALIEAHST